MNSISKIPIAITLLVFAYALTIAHGCGASSLGTQADLVAGAGMVTADADLMIVEARAHDLAADLDHAREVCGTDGCTDDEAAALRASRQIVKDRWAPVLECRDLVTDALSAWLGALDLAAKTSTDDVATALLLRYAALFVALYSDLGRCVAAAAPSVDIPDLPADLTALAGAFR